MADESGETFNIIDYAKTNLSSFAEVPFTEADAAILSWLSYLNFHEELQISFSGEGRRLGDLWCAEYFEELFVMKPFAADSYRLLAACTASPRFREVRVKYYRNEFEDDINLQFAAATFQIAPAVQVIAYRGTDSSLAGWKEDMLLTLSDPIPAQLMATDYLNRVASACTGALMVAGHSKGGNLAVFAGAHCAPEVRERLRGIYSFDGPGFRQGSLHLPEYEAIADRVVKLRPPASYFGMLFESIVEPRVVRSTSTGIDQHTITTWQLEPDGRFAEDASRDVVADFATSRINDWLNALSDSEMRIFIAAVFDLVSAVDAQSIEDLMGNLPQYLPDILKALGEMDEDRRKFLQYAVHLALVGNKRRIPRLKQDIIDSLADTGFQSYTDKNRFQEEFELFIR